MHIYIYIYVAKYIDIYKKEISNTYSGVGINKNYIFHNFKFLVFKTTRWLQGRLSLSSFRGP